MPTAFSPRFRIEPVGGRLQGLRILVTRPAPLDDQACELIRREGGQAISLPPIVIEPRTPAPATGEYDWVIFVSRNAVLHGHEWLAGLAKTPRLAAVGCATAEELERLGYSGVLRPDAGFTSEALLERAELNSVRGQQIMIVRGSGGRELIADTLRERGACVDYLEVYLREPARPSAERLAEIRRLFAASRISFVGVGSIEILDSLMTLLGPSAHALLARSQLVTASERVVKKAESLGLGGHILLASGPRDASLVDTIANDLRTSRKA